MKTNWCCGRALWTPQPAFLGVEETTATTRLQTGLCRNINLLALSNAYTRAGANAFGGALSQRLQKWLMDAALAERRPVKVSTGPG